jgi:dTDP-4-dehydrorhamnose reductase
MNRLLVTGASGFLGWNICRLADTGWTVLGTCFSHEVRIHGVEMLRADLTDFRELKRVFKEARPGAVIHAAALSNPNVCQTNPSRSREINVDASINIAGLCADLQVPCVFTSSDLVFDGLNPPYSEEAPVSPVSVYGKHKVMAEEGMMKRYPQTIICRMPLMFGDAGPVAESFIQPMLTTMKSGGELKLFTDEFRTPISARVAARGLFLALSGAAGILHLGGGERISRYDFGVLMMKCFGLPENRLVPCRQREVASQAPRPPDVSLDSGRAMKMGFEPSTLIDEMKHLLGTVEASGGPMPAAGLA